VSVLDGFYTTWSNAKATFGEGTPQTGEQYDGSAKLSQAQSTLDSAAPGSRWTGAASTAYGAANAEHQRIIGELSGLDKRLAAQVNQSAEVVANGRTQLDAVRQWVTDAAASVPPGRNQDRILMPIVSKGIGQVMDIVQKTNGELGSIGGKIRGIGGEYTALGDQKFAPKEGTGDALGVTGTESDEDIKKRAEEDVRKTLHDGDEEAAARVDKVLHGVAPYEPLTDEEAAYLHQMQVQQKDMSIQDIHAAEQQLGDHKNVIGDSWQLMSNDDVKYDDPDHPGQPITGSRDQLPDHVKTMMTIGTIADDPNRTGETEVRNMAEILKDGRSELQTGTEVDRGMIELSDRLMDYQSPTNEQAVRDIFDSAGRDHQIITDQLLGRNEGDRNGFLHDVNSMNWRDDGKSAGNLFSWTHDAANGPEAGVAAEAAEQYADYIGTHKDELLHIPGFGDQTLGQHNPELVKAYAHGLTPYMADIAGVSGGANDAFGDLDGGAPDKPIAKSLFAVLGTDRVAYVEFNGAADQLGLDKAHQWAEDVKNGRPVMAEDPRMADAAVLKGLVASGTAEGTHALGLNNADAADWRKAAYGAGVTGLSALAGPVGGPAVEIFGSAMESSVLGGPIDTGEGDPSPILPDEASRFAANALIADGFKLDGLDHYMVDGRVASVEEMNDLGITAPDHAALNTALSTALSVVVGANNPSKDFQLWYNQIVAGS
jgi:hypothetical protein